MSHPHLLRDLGSITSVVGLVGCFNPDKGNLDGETDAPASSSDAGTMNDDNVPDAEGPGDTTPGTDGESGPGDETADEGTTSETGQEETDTTGTGACGDGQVDPGELCFPSEPVTFATAAGARSIAVGRLNPNLDVVTTSESSYALSIMMGNGAGGFASPTVKTIGNPDTGAGPRGLSIGDLDDDDDLDIVALTNNELIWFRNNGAGQFSGSGATHPAGAFTARGHVFIDNFDANPAADIMYSDGYGICIGLGAIDPEGVYSISAGVDVNCNQRLQICEDGFAIPTEFGFDGDGYRDLFIGAAFSPDVGRGSGAGNGSFTLTACENGVDVCGGEQCQMSYLNAADVDDDSEVDIVASHDQGISVLLGNDDGSYDAPTFYATGSSEETKFSDVNADGHLDIVVASEGEQGIVLLLGNGDGTFDDPLVFVVGGPVFSVAVGDANNDDAPDLFTVIGTPDAGTVAVFLSDP